MRHDGMMMSPQQNNSNSSQGSNRKQSNHGIVVSNGNGDMPIPIVIHRKFFWKIIGIILIPLLGAISGFLSIFYKMDAHMDRIDIHPDISALETKLDAKVARVNLLGEVKREVRLEIREVKLDQKKHLDRISDELKEQQKKILTEVRRARQTLDDIR